MITPKAMQKVYQAMFSGKIKNIENVALIIASINVLITDVTEKGELVIEQLDK
jgi:hypothetical protein